jgi:hypothetical protein
MKLDELEKELLEECDIEGNPYTDVILLSLALKVNKKTPRKKSI